MKLLFLLLLTGGPLMEDSEVDVKSEQQILLEIVQSGRCAHLAEDLGQRVAPRPMVAPGPPPLLSFRYYEGKSRHRFGNVDLMLDDAGH